MQSRSTMSAMPRFFLFTAAVGLVMWLSDFPHPFPPIGLFVLGASAGGLLFSTAYVRAYMPYEWQRKSASWRRLFAFVHAPVPRQPSHAND